LLNGWKREFSSETSRLACLEIFRSPARIESPRAGKQNRSRRADTNMSPAAAFSVDFAVHLLKEIILCLKMSSRTMSYSPKGMEVCETSIRVTKQGDWLLQLARRFHQAGL
jgi:hypothetical protein